MIANETLLWTHDISEAMKAPQALVLLTNLDDLAIRPLLQLAPTPDDLLRAATYGEAAKARFFARRALLRQLLARRLGCAAEAVVVSADGSGAPRVATPKNDVFLSVSGRGALAAFAIAPRPIGVDIEILGQPEEVPGAMLHQAEAERLQGLNSVARHKAFLEIWTLKEAYLKALRIGLAREPAEIEARFAKGGDIRLFDHGAPVTTTACECRSEVLGREAIIAACVAM